ncbi:MAG: hypothetical protein JWQ71_1351 [Pedosphaera sp.]|nr:hypothetical protein [Pedosphaera sp.]
MSVYLTCLLLGAVLPATAQSSNTNTNAPEALVAAATANITGTVQRINRITRDVTLKTPDGSIVRLKVGRDLKNFDQLKKGDEVTVNYHQSTAVALAKPGEPMVEGAAEVLIAPEQGKERGATRVRTTQTTEVIQDIDAKKRMVTLKDAEGNIHKVKVDESVGDLNRFKKGDEIVIKSTEAVAIDVSKPGQ